jgi:hypothetical protein
VFIEFPELEASGLALVRAIEPCPAIASGTGQVVTARILTRQVSQLVEITIEDGSTLTGTPQHPVWSVEREDWAELGDLVAGEHLWTEDGQVEILATQPLTSGESVYNLEIHRQHVYQVAGPGVLVHNAGAASIGHYRRRKDGTFGKKRGPKTSDTAPHNAKIIEIRNKIIADGGTIIAGGRTGLKERVVITLSGKARRPDILYRDKAGKIRAVNVGKVNATGNPIPREQAALMDLRTKFPTDFVPYN